MMNKTRPGQRLEAAREGGRTLQFRSYHGSSEGGREDAAVQRHVKNAWFSNMEVAREGGFVQLKVRHQVLATVGGDSYP